MSRLADLLRRVREGASVSRPSTVCPARLRCFLVDTRAGATAIAAAAVTVMVVGGVGLLIDHNWLVFKRDMLKSAADSAAIAATLALQDIPSVTSDAQVLARLQPVAERYARFNVLANARDPDLAADDITVTLDVDRSTGAVSVVVGADIGSVLAGWLHDSSGPGLMKARAGSAQSGMPLALVLAIDLSASMQSTFSAGDSTTRIESTQRAAKTLVTTVDPNPREPTLVGVVGWSYDVHSDDVLELTTSAALARSTIDDFRADGGPTYSASGIRRATTMLAAADDDLHKALVLLTDGADNMRYDENGRRVDYCPASDIDEAGNRAPEFACRLPRREACAGAKEQDIEVFVVAAMDPAHVQGSLAHELRLCASADDDAHVFINNTDAAALEAAFKRISRSFTPLRRTH